MSLRAFLAGLALLSALPAAAVAQDSARVAVIGFAKDGSSFAFEQFGLVGQDQSPYSDLQILGTATGLPIEGAPFRTAFDAKAASPDAVRRITYDAAQRTLKRLEIGEPGVILARGSGKYQDKSALEVPVSIDTLGAGTLRIENKDVKDKTCESMGVKAHSLTVDVVDQSGKSLRMLVNEQKIPPERFCPLGYALVELRAFARQDKPPVLALLLARTVPSMNGTSRAYQVHLIDLAAEPIAAGEKKSGH